MDTLRAGFHDCNARTHAKPLLLQSERGGTNASGHVNVLSLTFDDFVQLSHTLQRSRRPTLHENAAQARTK